MNTDTTDYRFECIVNLKFIKIIIGYIQCYSGNGLVQCLYYYRLYSVTVETVSFSAVFILLSVIFSYSGNGLVQCLYYSRLYSVLQ